MIRISYGHAADGRSHPRNGQATTNQPTLSWSVFIKDVPPKFVGIIDTAPHAETAIEHAIERYRVPPNERGWLVVVGLPHRSKNNPYARLEG